MVAFLGSWPAWPFMALPQPEGQPAEQGDEPGRGKAGRVGGTRTCAFGRHLLAQRTLQPSRQASCGPDSCHLVLKWPCFLLAKLQVQTQLPGENPACGCLVTDKGVLVPQGPRASCPALLFYHAGFHPYPLLVGEATRMRHNKSVGVSADSRGLTSRDAHCALCFRPWPPLACVWGALSTCVLWVWGL